MLARTLAERSAAFESFDRTVDVSPGKEEFFNVKALLPASWTTWLSIKPCEREQAGGTLRIARSSTEGVAWS
jgi:hypothetical protein